MLQHQAIDNLVALAGTAQAVARRTPGLMRSEVLESIVNELKHMEDHHSLSYVEYMRCFTELLFWAYACNLSNKV